MATLILTTVGTALGGPIGGALGSLLGNQIDRAVFKPGGRVGPRLKELAVTSSSYGTPIPRYFGTMRAAGSVIWATDLVETSETTGGGKSSPSVKTYSYSCSFAVALASRPIARLGRIWADGRLLRGAAGDLKVGGMLRVHQGYGDQQPDPLLASAEGALCPAFRGLAYCVFESLQLAEFGNRIPTLAFEITSDDGEVSLVELLEPLEADAAITRGLEGLGGFSDEGGPVLASLELLDRVYPLACDVGAGPLAIHPRDPAAAPAATLPEAVVDPANESFGGAYGQMSTRRTDHSKLPSAMRYYDVARDYQPGLQRAGGQAPAGQSTVIDFPGALQAGTALRLIEAMATREGVAGDRLQWRMAELDARIAPGALVAVPGRPGKWRVESWEWRDTGVELELTREPGAALPPAIGDPGRNLETPDEVATPTVLMASELPWDGLGTRDERQVIAAASSSTSGWTGAMLYADHGGSLSPLRGTRRQRAVVGTLSSLLPPADPAIIDRTAAVDVTLASPDFELASRPLESLAAGANRLLVGAELLQFAHAESIGGSVWRLSGLLRGRGGTEAAALTGTAAGANVVLLDERPIRLDAADLGTAEAIAAIGLADDVPAEATIANAGLTLRPLVPVHPRLTLAADGSATLSWTRRARGAWSWSGTVEPPLAEEFERYAVGLGDTELPEAQWEVTAPTLQFSAPDWAALRAEHPGKALWVRQIGNSARSDPLYLTTLA
ncbi:phage tail protein [Aurantiacibacter suaedae]|uniref:phage tail protein n=1 Tax=Aurantiacibacter suaedae TaxID=2545755 RepID=UPI0010F557D7|nr:phage tail protein [Aurantiacibacter suaedae]